MRPAAEAAASAPQDQPSPLSRRAPPQKPMPLPSKPTLPPVDPTIAGRGLPRNRSRHTLRLPRTGRAAEGVIPTQSAYPAYLLPLLALHRLQSNCKFLKLSSSLQERGTIWSISREVTGSFFLQALHFPFCSWHSALLRACRSLVLKRRRPLSLPGAGSNYEIANSKHSRNKRER